MRNRIRVAGGLILVVGITALSSLVSCGEPEPAQPAPPGIETWVHILAKDTGSTVEIERAVTSRIEARCARVEDVLGTHSRTSAGSAEVTVRFPNEVTPTAALARVGAVLREMQTVAPDAEMFLHATPADGRLTYVLSGGAGRPALSRLAVALSDRLATTPGVEQVDRIGDLREQVTVTLDPAKVRAHELDTSQIVAALQRALLPTEVLKRQAQAAGKDVGVGTRGTTPLRQALGEAVLGLQGDQPILLRDIATVRVAPGRSEGRAFYRGDDAVLVRVASRADAAQDVQKEVEVFAAGMPRDTRLIPWPDAPTHAVVNIEWGPPPGSGAEYVAAEWVALGRALRASRMSESLVWTEGTPGGRRAGASAALRGPADLQAFFDAVGTIPGLDLHRIDTRGQGAPASLVLSVEAPDLAELQRLANRVGQSLRSVRGILFVAHDAPRTVPTYQVKVDHARAARLGLTEADIANQAALWLGGRELPATPDVPVVVQFATEARRPADIRIQAGDQWVPLSAVAELSLASSVGWIHHIDGRRAATVTAILAPHAKRADVLRAARAVVADLAPPPDAVRWAREQTAPR